MFSNISDYNNLNNYLPIFLASLIVYIGSIIYISYFDSKKKEKLKKFYDSFNIGVILTDILLIIISMNRTRYLFPYIFSHYSLKNFLLTSAMIQIVYDIFLADLYNLIPSKSSLYFSFLKENDKILKVPIIITNVITNISAILIASYLASFNIVSNINLLLSLLSIIPYLIYFVK